MRTVVICIATNRKEKKECGYGGSVVANRLK